MELLLCPLYPFAWRTTPAGVVLLLTIPEGGVLNELCDCGTVNLKDSRERLVKSCHTSQHEISRQYTGWICHHAKVDINCFCSEAIQDSLIESELVDAEANDTGCDLYIYNG